MADDQTKGAGVVQREPATPPATTRASTRGSSTTATPSEWRSALYPDSESGRPHPEAFKHAAASALHGWELHRYHAGEEIQLSRADYEAAVKAASDLADGNYTAHSAARSPHLAEPEKLAEKGEVKS